MKTLSKLAAVVFCLTLCSCYYDPGYTGSSTTTYYTAGPSVTGWPITPRYTQKGPNSHVLKSTTHYYNGSPYYRYHGYRTPYYRPGCSTNTFLYYKK